MKNYYPLFFFLACMLSYGSNRMPKEINISRHKNLEVLFTIYNQIWTPFAEQNVSEHMLKNTSLMKLNHDYFKAYNNHDAVTKTKEFLKRSGTDFFLYSFYYSDFPKSKRIKEIPNILTKDLNNDRKVALKELDDLMSEISKFYIDSNFEKFLDDYGYIYSKAALEVSHNLPEANFIERLETYFGTSYSQYKFYIIPFFKTEFGMAHLLNNDGFSENITFISPFLPAEIDIDGRLSSVGYDSQEDILAWVIHEYSHTFFNPALTTKENLDALNTYKTLYKPVEDEPQIGTWSSMFAEHLAVAFEVRMFEILGDTNRSYQIIKRHENYIYLDHFIEQLELFENNRDKYESINDFMKRLIHSCQNLL